MGQIFCSSMVVSITTPQPSRPSTLRTTSRPHRFPRPTKSQIPPERITDDLKITSSAWLTVTPQYNIQQTKTIFSLPLHRHKHNATTTIPPSPGNVHLPKHPTDTTTASPDSPSNPYGPPDHPPKSLPQFPHYSSQHLFSPLLRTSSTPPHPETPPSLPPFLHLVICPQNQLLRIICP